METPKIFAAIAAIMNEVGSIGKDRKNAQQGYNFRGIDDMYNAIHPLFKEHQVFITSTVLDSKREERQTQKGTGLIYSIVRVKFTFWTVDGSNIESVMEGEGMDSGDKATNKAMSVALKYALMQMFLIPTEELAGMDPDAESHQVKPKTAAAAPAPQQPAIYDDGNIRITAEDYRKPTNDIEKISVMINHAASTTDLKTFVGCNRNFFATNKEMFESLTNRGKVLAAQEKGGK